MFNKSRISEIIVTTILFIILSVLVFFILDPQELIGRSRDAKRMDDLNKIQSALDLYQINHDFHYPQNLSFLNQYLSPLPLDPVLQNSYGYKTNSDLSKYELNANLESQKFQQKEKTDGGDNKYLFETGTSLTLIEEGLYNNDGYNPSPQKFEITLPRDKTAIPLIQTDKGCLFEVSLFWGQAEDPGDTVKYYYYIDNDKNFTEPEISGNTEKTEYLIQQVFENKTCSQLETETFYVVILAQDSNGNLINSNPIEINPRIPKSG